MFFFLAVIAFVLLDFIFPKLCRIAAFRPGCAPGHGDDHRVAEGRQMKKHWEATKPFAGIGDLAEAVTEQENVAVWNGQRGDGARYRLIAKGRDRQATIIYLIAGNAELE